MGLFLQQAKASLSKYCQREQDFSRNRLLSFEKVAYFILNLSKRSLAIELNDFLLVGVGGNTLKLPDTQDITEEFEYL